MLIENQTEIVALGLILWTILLVVALVLYRTRLVILTQKAANSFSPTGEDLSAIGTRLTRSYANCTEFVPLMLGLLLFAIATGQTEVTDGLAYFVLGARIAHSSLHIASGKPVAVSVRSLLFWVQITISLYWVMILTRAYL